jgi:O-antigen/teichoic acid export membrane protein
MFFLAIPAHAIIMYYFSFTKFFFWVSIGFLIIVGGIGWILIPSYGILGASLTMLLAQSFNFFVPLAWVIRKFRE